MSEKQTSRYCPQCETQRLAVGRGPNHVLHLFLTLISAGIWGIVWIILAVTTIGNFRCSKCGTPV